MKKAAQLEYIWDYLVDIEMPRRKTQVRAAKVADSGSSDTPLRLFSPTKFYLVLYVPDAYRFVRADGNDLPVAVVENDMQDGGAVALKLGDSVGWDVRVPQANNAIPARRRNEVGVGRVGKAVAAFGHVKVEPAHLRPFQITNCEGAFGNGSAGDDCVERAAVFYFLDRPVHLILHGTVGAHHL